MRAAIRCVLKVSDSVWKGGFVCSLKLVAEMLNHRLSMLFVQINTPIAQRDWRKLWQGNIYSFLRSLKRSCLMLQLIWKISLAAPLSGVACFCLSLSYSDCSGFNLNMLISLGVDDNLFEASTQSWIKPTIHRQLWSKRKNKYKQTYSIPVHRSFTSFSKNESTTM